MSLTERYLHTPGDAEEYGRPVSEGHEASQTIAQQAGSLSLVRAEAEVTPDEKQERRLRFIHESFGDEYGAV